MTAATFTIAWTNPKASAALRRKSTISPSAQSISVTVNGKLIAVANRNGSPTQTIALDAPVGIDAFAFSVFDQTNATGHLLGTATVTQQIVDGAANAVSASIVATCAATNVTYANDDFLSIHHLAPGGAFSQVLQSILLAGNSSASLIVEPQDADGNVIISGTSGTVTGSVTGSATVTPIDGAHVLLTPLTGPRNATPDTLTLAAPGCPAATVAVQHSPAIYAESGNGSVKIEDWYGDIIAAVTIAPNDVLIGYDVRLKDIVTYNPSSGQVTEYSLDMTSSFPLYVVGRNNAVTWSNYLNSVFGAVSMYEGPMNFLVTYYTVRGGNQVTVTALPGFAGVTSLAASSFSTATYAFSTDTTGIYQFNLAAFGLPGYYLSPGIPFSFGVDDAANTLITFDNSGPYVAKNTLPLPSTASTSNDGFTAFPVKGAVDTDDHNVYAIVSGGILEASSAAGTPLSGFPQTVGPGIAVVVVSANEH